MVIRFWDWENPGVDLYLHCYNTFSSHPFPALCCNASLFYIMSLINTYWFFLPANLCPVWMFFSNILSEIIKSVILQIRFIMFFSKPNPTTKKPVVLSRKCLLIELYLFLGYGHWWSGCWFLPVTNYQLDFQGWGAGTLCSAVVENSDGNVLFQEDTKNHQKELPSV